MSGGGIDDPFALGDELASGMAELGEKLRRRSSRFDAAVVEYLFRAGWQPIHALRVGEKELLALWALALDSIASGRFGVADERWRTSAAYPDRFFPTLWLDIVPQLASDGPDWLEQTTQLFNLGERLVQASRAVANAVAAELAEAAEELGSDFEGTVRLALQSAGVLESTGEPDAGLVPIATVSLHTFDPSFLAASLELSDAGVLWVYGADGRALVATLTGVGAEVQGFESADNPAIASLECDAGDRRFRLEGTSLVVRGSGPEQRANTDLIYPVALAVNASGVAAIADGLSGEIAIFQAR